jgi:alkylated DNA nucleotide flippase Atl1
MRDQSDGTLDWRYVRVASQVRRGEWTTYGDIATVIHGDGRAAVNVGRAAARLPDFPNPHRILQYTGRIAAQWRDSLGGGSDECRRRLEAEGIRFTDDRADSAQRVTADVLAERIRRQQASDLP